MFFGYVTKKRACPRCQSTDVYRIRRSGITVRAVCNVLNVRPHWCANCDNFFLAPRPEKSARIERQYGVSNADPSGGHLPQADQVPH